MIRPLPPRSTACLAIAHTSEVLQRLPESHSTWLSGSEQVRLQRLHVPQRRDHYLAGHWLVRELLADAFAGSAADAVFPQWWELQEVRGEAPRVTNLDNMHVSISHSGDWIAAAVARRPVGIDIEQRPRVLDPAIEELLLNLDEAHGSLDNDDLLQRWVAKEAWLKSRGESASPERIRHLQLLACDDDSADVICYQSDDFHFAVVTAADATLNWFGQAGAWRAMRWHLRLACRL